MNDVPKRKLRVLFFTSALATGGAEMHLLRLVNHLDRERFEPLLAVARRGGSYESALCADVPIHVVGRVKRSSTLSMVSAVGPLRRLIESERPDIVCSFLNHANTVAMLASRRLSYQPKVVLGVQNPPSIQYRHSRSAFSRLIFASIIRLYPQADKIVALTQGVAEDIATISPRCASLTEVIYNAGLDDRVLQGAAEPLPSTDSPPHPLLVACGRLTEQKGYPYLLEAFKQVRKTVPAHLWILGEGHLRQQMEETIQREGWQECVRLLGFQNNPYQYMAAADVFVLSSIYEGFGNVVVEAMASGAAVVATDCPYGPGEIITPESGLLVPPAQSSPLAEAIVRVLQDDQLRQALVEGGKQRAQTFSADAIADRYGDLFRNLSRQAPATPDQ